jgi:hypothetical protein
MMLEDSILTLTVEHRDDADGVWLCVENGFVSEPIAQFVSESAVAAFHHANNLAYRKAHATGRMGI